MGDTLRFSAAQPTPTTANWNAGSSGGTESLDAGLRQARLWQEGYENEGPIGNESDDNDSEDDNDDNDDDDDDDESNDGLQSTADQQSKWWTDRRRVHTG